MTSVPPPAAPAPYATVAIVTLCVVLFAAQGALSEPAAWNFVLGFAMIPGVVMGDRPLPAGIPTFGGVFSLFSAMFLHADSWHLIGNMLFLWLFGDSVETAIGHLRFTLFYLLCGLGGAAGQILSDPGSLEPVVGASGAISGVLAAAVVLHPRSPLSIPLPGGVRFRLPVPVYVALGGWLGIQIMEAVTGGPDNTVAWWAHLGGFLTGAVLVAIFRRLLPMKTPLT
ncbi:membrane protein [Skermanella stibiiresistens SB22]|uniref:Membrane protein n=1 Tax=Skermanella stibiiresistens SB22 TaxID=1385369 RepID=W9H896_9PROT|nr:rhomboid family intramembrane serine protease [Skermanella stibiiresistens]EWY40981.1 membrane protein [Skermanella stibiiresistens SB22]